MGLLERLGSREILIPHIESSMLAENWPESYSVEIDTSPYYGQRTPEGEFLEIGSGDGRFHPSSHALACQRDLYIAFHPKLQHLRPPFRKDLAFYMTVNFGTAIHGLLQAQLGMSGLLVPNTVEYEYDCEEHNVRGRIDAVIQPPNHGEVVLDIKALACTTPVPTPKGWTTMGELKDGDEVFAEDGSATRCIAHPIRLGRPCYRLLFEGGEQIVADEDHLWKVWNRVVKRYETLTTKQIAEKGLTYGATHPQSRYAVDVNGPAQYPEADLPIDPYLLGYWLGDGSYSTTQLAVGEQDLPHIVEVLKGLGIEYTLARPEGKCPSVYLKGIRKSFTDQHLLLNKHIPEAYMMASRDQRHALLQGVMDSDGTVGAHYASVGMKREALMRQVLELATGLGYKASFRESRSVLNGVEVGDHYTVQFNSAHPNPFRMERKRTRYEECRPPATESWSLRTILVIEEVPSVATRYITVEHRSSCYLVGHGYIVTHNTINSRGFSFLKAHEPRESWDIQVNLGMEHYGADEGLILAVEAGYPWGLKELPIKRRSYTTERVYEKWERVTEAIQHDDPLRCTCETGLCWAGQIDNDTLRSVA